MLRPRYVIIDHLEDGPTGIIQQTKTSPVEIVTNVAICQKIAPFHKNSVPAASAPREDTSSMPAQPAFASTVLCLCLLLTDVMEDLPGKNDVTDVIC